MLPTTPCTPPTTTTTVDVRRGGWLQMGPMGTQGLVRPYTSAPKSSWDQCYPPLHPQPLPTTPRSPFSTILGMTTTSGPYLRAADLSDLGKGVSALISRLLHLFTNGLHGGKLQSSSFLASTTASSCTQNESSKSVPSHYFALLDVLFVNQGLFWGHSL